jgi:hypothetical protein
MVIRIAALSLISFLASANQNAEDLIKHLTSTSSIYGGRANEFKEPSEEALLQVLSKVSTSLDRALGHKDRRRESNDPNRACDETSDRDTDDEDCHFKRFTMLAKLYGYQSGLKKKEVDIRNQSDKLKSTLKEVMTGLATQETAVCEFTL